MIVRELRYTISRPGYRPREITLVTMLLDERRYSTQNLADLDQQRWSIEINFRHLKIMLGMDQLHCLRLRSRRGRKTRAEQRWREPGYVGTALVVVSIIGVIATKPRA